MISFITGKVGGGKSCLALAKMLDHMAKGNGVASNINLKLDKVAEEMDRRKVPFHPRQFTWLDLTEERDFRERIMKGIHGHNYEIYLDEAQTLFNAKDDALLKKLFSPLINYVTQSRKFYNDIYFITQAPETVINQFRLQCQVGYSCTDMRTHGLGIPFLGLAWEKYDWSSGTSLEKGNTPLRRSMLACFDTMQLFDKDSIKLAEDLPTFQPVTKQEIKALKRNEDSNTVHDRGNGRSWWPFLRVRKDRSQDQSSGQGDPVEQPGEGDTESAPC